MAQVYEDLSRRALIKLDHDFDRDNDAALLRYLADAEEPYEGIRIVERATVKVDNTMENIKDVAKRIKDAYAENECFIGKVLDTVCSKIIG